MNDTLRLYGLLRLYRQALVDNGIPVPDDDGTAEFELACRRMVAAAADFMDAALELRNLYGPAAELLAAQSWRDAA